MKVMLHEQQQARQALGALLRNITPTLSLGKRLWLHIQEETRTLPQNAKFHAICSDIAKSDMQWMGKKRSAKQWKVLLVSGHAVATKEQAELVPGLEGEYVNLRESTALMSIPRGASLIEYAIAFCAMNNITLSDPDDYLNWGLQ